MTSRKRITDGAAGPQSVDDNTNQDAIPDDSHTANGNHDIQPHQEPEASKFNLKICDCKFYISCSAPICPIDHDWKKRKHLSGERICYYLVEYSKSSARPILRGSLPIGMYTLIAEVYPQIIKQIGPIRRKLKYCSNNPARIRLIDEDIK